jgi:hypothetical protein
MDRQPHLFYEFEGDVPVPICAPDDADFPPLAAELERRLRFPLKPRNWLLRTPVGKNGVKPTRPFVRPRAQAR